MKERRWPGARHSWARISQFFRIGGWTPRRETRQALRGGDDNAIPVHAAPDYEALTVADPQHGSRHTIYSTLLPSRSVFTTIRFQGKADALCLSKRFPCLTQLRDT